MKKIKLTQGKFALVDDEDFEELNKYKWCVHKRRNNHYAKLSIGDSTIMMHRYIMKAKEGQIIDHKDGDGINNQRDNLRFCTLSQNQINRGLQKNNTSGFKGVCFYGGKWVSRIRVNNKKINLGCFITKIEAAKAYNEAALRYFKEFAKLNIVPAIG